MNFAEGHIYHVYNRGNNSQQVFYTRENYLYFLNKLYAHILPYADVLAWCLMPNHFHLMISVDKVELASEGFTLSEALTKRTRTLNDSIGIILRSYSRAVQKQERITGSLFQKETKALCLTEPQGISPAYFNTHFGTVGNIDWHEDTYLDICFEYIHRNPVDARLVENPEDWEYSSYRDYFCGRNGRLINRTLAGELGLLG